MGGKPLVLLVLLHAPLEFSVSERGVDFAFFPFTFLLSSSLSFPERAEGQQGRRAEELSLAPMSAYVTPSPSQGRRNNRNGGGGNSTALDHRSSEPSNSYAFDSDASLSSVGALTRDLPPYASSPPIEAVVFAWGERELREKERKGFGLIEIDPAFFSDLDLRPLLLLPPSAPLHPPTPPSRYPAPR